MKGLMRNNFFAVCANAKVFSVFMLAFGIFSVAVVSQSLQIGYVLIGIVGFSVNGIFVAKNGAGSKWGKYKLTLPVKRADIVKSLFWNQIIWMLVGTAFGGAEIGLSTLLHGCAFDFPIDILSLFAMGISISLFMGALFLPLFYLGGEERGEVLLVIALLCAFGLDFVIISVCNDLFAPGVTGILLGNLVLLVCPMLAFALSYPVTVGIFKRKEY